MMNERVATMCNEQVSVTPPRRPFSPLPRRLRFKGTNFTGSMPTFTPAPRTFDILAALLAVVFIKLKINFGNRSLVVFNEHEKHISRYITSNEVGRS